MEEIPFADEHLTFPTTRALIGYIEETPNAIGFGGIAYGENVKHCAINGVEPTEANVENDRYPLARYLYLYTVDKPTRDVRQFIDWVIGEQGQRIVEQTGYIPIWLAD
jgi:phosphate transport system substrate-binding protein